MIRSRSTDVPALVAGLLLSFGASFAPAVARADDTAESRRLFARGEEAYGREAWDEALEAYTSAYEVAPLPGFLFNIGQCHRKLGHWDAAADFFRRYLEALPDAPNRADAEELLVEVEAHLAPESTPARPPIPAPAPPARPRRVEPPEGGTSVGLPTWIALGAGVALGGVAVAFALDLSAAQSSFDDPSLDCARNPDRCRSLRDRGDTAALARTVFALCAGAALAAGGVLLVLDLRAARSPAETLAGSPRLRLGLNGVAAEVTW